MLAWRRAAHGTRARAYQIEARPARCLRARKAARGRRAHMKKTCRWRLQVAALAVLVFALAHVSAVHAQATGGRPALMGMVKDSLGRPLEGVLVQLDARSGARVATTRSEASGAFSFEALPPGTYAVVAHARGFKPAIAIATVVAGRAARVQLSMESQEPLSLKLSAPRLRPARNAVAPGGVTAYHFSQQAIRELPLGENGTVNQVLLQVLDLGQLSPRFAESIDVLTGALPAEYGYRTGAVVDIHTRRGEIANGGSVGYFGGQRETVQPSFEYGGSRGGVDYYATGYFLHNVRGVNPPTPGPDPLNDFTNQGGSFLYLSDLLNTDTSISLIGASFVHDFGWPATPDQPQVF